MKNPAVHLDEPLSVGFFDELDDWVSQKRTPCSLEEFMVMEMSLFRRYHQSEDLIAYPARLNLSA